MFFEFNKSKTMSKNQVKSSELRLIKSFGQLSDELLSKLSMSMVRRRYAPGQFIFFEDDKATGLWFILEGKVKISKQSDNGRLQGLCLANPGKCFGSCPLFDTETNPANAQALDEVTLAILPRDSVQDLIYSDVDIATSLLKVYTDRMGLLARLGECLGTWTVGMRINDCLIAHAKSVDNVSVVQLTHEEIATLVGTAREVVTRHLSELESADLIVTCPGEITLLEPEIIKSPCIAQQGDS